MTENKWSLEDWAKNHCELIDELAEIKLKPGTPCYEFQQDSIRIVKRYRERKKCANGLA